MMSAKLYNAVQEMAENHKQLQVMKNFLRLFFLSTFVVKREFFHVDSVRVDVRRTSGKSFRHRRTSTAFYV